MIHSNQPNLPLTGKCLCCCQTLCRGDQTCLIKNPICTKSSTSSWTLLNFVIWRSSTLLLTSRISAGPVSTDLPTIRRLATDWLQWKAGKLPGGDGNVLVTIAALEQGLHKLLRKWLLSSWCSATVIPIVQNYPLLPLRYLSNPRNVLPPGKVLPLLGEILQFLSLPALIISSQYQQLCGKQSPGFLRTSQQDLRCPGSCMTGTNRHPALPLNATAEIQLANLTGAWRETVNWCWTQLKSSWNFW